MNSKHIASRHIHLDFHTSEMIEGVCDQFDANEFAQTLSDAHVNSVTLFSCCHHGNLYYNSKIYPEMIHPSLAHRDLLREQTDACHKLGIQVNLYATIRWNKRIADQHPEWVCIDENGALQDYKGNKYFEAGFYKNLCVNTGYRDFLKTQIGEVLANIPAEGVWFDAAFMNECCCVTCQEMMRGEGLDPTNKEDRKIFARSTYYDMVKDLSDFAKKFNPDFNVCFNKGHVGYLDKPVISDYSYFAFESLPGADWGYMDFPVSAKYMKQFGNECFGMTSRFHTEWGDFHAYRNPVAMEYEIFSMLANGCKCIVGDQMDYWGQLNSFMYEQIGQIFASVEEKEPWCNDAESVCEIAVFTAEEFYPTDIAGHIPGASEGVCRILTELGYQFCLIDSESDFTDYKLLILPDVIPVNELFAEKLQLYLENGGKILASYHSGLDTNKERFVVSELAVKYLGEAEYSPDFIVPKGHFTKWLPETEHVMYKRGVFIEAGQETTYIQMATRPVFNRSFEHFCSHLHSPSAREICYPAIVGTENTTYFIHPVFSQYQENGPHWYKTLILAEIERLIGKPQIIHNGPMSLQINLLEQRHHNRQVIHFLHYIPQRKCKVLDLVDEKIPLFNLSVEIQNRNDVQTVTLVPENQEIEFDQSGGKLKFILPEVNGHQMVAINFK